MQAHQRDRAALFGHVVQIAHQRDVFQERVERCVLGFLLELGHRAHELADILHARARLVRILALVLFLQLRLFNQLFHKLRKPHHLAQGHEVRHQRGEIGNALSRAAGQRFGRFEHDVEQRLALRRRAAAQLRNRRISDRAPRRIDDARQRYVIGRVDQRAQIGHDVLDLAAIVELRRAVDAVGQARAHKHFFHNAALRVHAVEDGDIAVILAGLAHLADAVAHPGRLLALVARVKKRDRRSLAQLRPQLFLLAAFVMRDNVVRRVEDVGGGAVILFELDNAAVREILLEFQNVADIRAAPAIDGLIVVADDAHVMPLARQQAHEHILRVVRILILVYMDIMEAIAIRLQHRRMVRQQLERFHQQVVEIERVRAAQLLLVFGVIIVNQLAAVVAVRLLEPLVRPEQVIFRIGNLCADLFNRQILIVDVQLLAQVLQNGRLVVVVVDGEAAGIAQPLDIAPEDARAAGVERGNPHISGAVVRQPVDALAHFPGGLVGEGNRQDLRGGHAQFQKVRDAAGQRTGFSRTRPGQDQHRAFRSLDRLPLLRVQRAQIHLTAPPFSFGPESCGIRPRHRKHSGSRG